MSLTDQDIEEIEKFLAGTRYQPQRDNRWWTKSVDKHGAFQWWYVISGVLMVLAVAAVFVTASVSTPEPDGAEPLIIGLGILAAVIFMHVCVYIQYAATADDRPCSPLFSPVVMMSVPIVAAPLLAWWASTV